MKESIGGRAGLTRDPARCWNNNIGDENENKRVLRGLARGDREGVTNEGVTGACSN